MLWLIISLLTTVGLGFIAWPLLRNNKPRNYLVTAVTCMLIILFALGFYLATGRSQEVIALQSSKLRAEAVKTEIKKFGSRKNIIIALRTKLMQLPNDKSSAKGWYILGKLYYNEKDFQGALESFQKAVELNGDEDEYVLQYVSLDYYLNHNFSHRDLDYIAKVLAKTPNNVNAINLLAINDYEHKNYEQAIRRWESLLTMFPADSEDAKALLEMIRQAQQKTDNVELAVDVLVDPKLKNQIASSDTLFVYALEPQGQKVPLAVVRLVADRFPKHIILDKSNSMLATHALAKGKRVWVEARISKTGNALPQEGDLSGKSAVLELGVKNQVKVIIANRDSATDK